MFLLINLELLALGLYSFACYGCEFSDPANFRLCIFSGIFFYFILIKIILYMVVLRHNFYPRTFLLNLGLKDEPAEMIYVCY